MRPGIAPWLFAVAVVACGDASRPTAVVPRHETHEPVVVAIVVDQLSAWVAASRWPELPPDGGFARLRREGTWVKDMRLAHAVTDTGPGHASLHTGTPPAENGIYANELPAGDHRVSIVHDDATRGITSDGEVASPGSSAARLRVDTVADRLRAARPDALVVSLSLKDRGAILPAGKRPTHALWYDARLDRFVTSTAFETAFPRWASSIADSGAAARARAAPWEPLDAAWLARHAATPDDAPGEGDLDGLGVTFPHRARTPEAFRTLPASDAMLAELALAAIAAEYVPTRPTLLLLSFSASDIVGHVFGPDSWEAWDQLRRLDRTLGLFLSELERRVGAVSVVLAADHGNLSMPEAQSARDRIPACAAHAAQPPPDRYDRPCTAGLRVGPKAVGAELEAAARMTLGPGEWIAGVADPYVHLGAAAHALDEPRRAMLDATVRRVLARHEAIADVFDARELAAKCPGALASARPVPERALPGEPVLALVCRSWAPGLGGDYYVTTKRGSFWDGEVVPGKGASHGTPYLYDRTVPLLVRAAGDAAAGAVIDAPVDFSAYAAIEAHLLGLDARTVPEILRALQP